MEILRQGPAPEDDYSLYPIRLAQDPNVSLGAKALYLYLGTFRDEESMSAEDIGKGLGVHRSTVAKYIRELEAVGYLAKSYPHSNGRTLGEVEYVLFDEPWEGDPNGNS